MFWYVQKSKRDADDAWDRLKGTDEANRTLQSEKFEFQEKTVLLEKQQRALICALALISGSYFPLLARSRQLCEQRAILVQQSRRFASQVSLLYSHASSSLPFTTNCDLILNFSNLLT